MAAPTPDDSRHTTPGRGKDTLVTELRTIAPDLTQQEIVICLLLYAGVDDDELTETIRQSRPELELHLGHICAKLNATTADALRGRLQSILNNQNPSPQAGHTP